MVSKDDAAVALSHAAASYHDGGYPSTVGPEFEALASAAMTWARACSATPPVRAPSGPTSGLVIPFGKTKGQPIEAEPDKGLHYMVDAMQRSIDDASKERWRDSNMKLRDACLAELARRGK